MSGSLPNVMREVQILPRAQHFPISTERRQSV